MEILLNNDMNKFSLPIFSGPENNIITLPARAEVVRKFKINTSEDIYIPEQEIEKGIFIPRTITSKSNKLLRVLNINNEIRSIPENIHITFEPLSNYNVCNLSLIKEDPKRSEKLIEILKERNNLDEFPQLSKLCKEYQDIFAILR